MTNSRPRRRGHKNANTRSAMVIKTLYHNILRYPLEQPILRNVCMWAQVQGLKESRLTIRGTGIRVLFLMRRFGQVSLYSPHRLISQTTTLWDRSFKAAEGPSTRPLVLSIITTSEWVGYATKRLNTSLGQRAERVPTNNQRGRG